MVNSFFLELLECFVLRALLSVLRCAKNMIVYLVVTRWYLKHLTFVLTYEVRILDWLDCFCGC